MVILALDVSKMRTGWAQLVNSNVQVYGSFSPPKQLAEYTQSDPAFAKLLYWYYTEIKKLIRMSIPDIVVMEDLNIRFAPTAKVMLQFHSIAKLASYIASSGKCQLHLLNNRTVKSMFKVTTKKHLIPAEIKTLARKLKIPPVKVLMVNEINKYCNLKLDYTENDEADAIALGVTCYIKKGTQSEEA
jgi:Holliday junction resolvasome RuvABC endonuclease subunit